MFKKNIDKTNFFYFEKKIENLDDKYNPVPTKSMIPEWYKETASYISDNRIVAGDKDRTSSTIKKCVPIFDSLTCGYLLLTPTDIFVENRDGQPFYRWPNFEIIGFHTIEQASLYPSAEKYLSLPKLMNQFYIKTPKGYSTLFIPPMHRDNVIQILPAIVDTDLYHNEINFPFVLNSHNFEGLIPAGTPFAQLIPIKRKSFKMKIGNYGLTKIANKQRFHLFSTFQGYYRNNIWKRKQYN
jgi:hypothetical protein